MYHQGRWRFQLFAWGLCLLLVPVVWTGRARWATAGAVAAGEGDDVGATVAGDGSASDGTAPAATRGSAGVWTLGPYVSVQVNVDALGNNITGDAANSPAIAVDPVDPNRIVIGWQKYPTVSSSVSVAGLAYSRDGGGTWSVPGVLHGGVAHTDPAIDVDADGTFYYLTLRSDPAYQPPTVCDLYRSYDGGVTWDWGLPALCGARPWLAIDRTGGTGRGNVYALWEYRCCGEGVFARLKPGATAFSYPVPVPLYRGAGCAAVAPDGTVAVVGGGAVNPGPVVVARSSSARDPATPPAFEFASTFNLGTHHRLGRILLAIDDTGGAHHGTFYALSLQDPPEPASRAVMFARSTDNGQTWSAPMTLNGDSIRPYSTAAQHAAMAVAPTGRIDVVWGDGSADSSSYYATQLYYAYSFDGGSSWSSPTPVTPAFGPAFFGPPDGFGADPCALASREMGAYVAYAATFNDEMDVYYLWISRDCNGNGIADETDLATGASTDCNRNLIVDDCEPDCQPNDVADECDIAWGHSADCNANAIPDECDIATGTHQDCNANQVPDECDAVNTGAADCNGNGILDVCDLFADPTADCDHDGVHDGCQLAGRDCNGNGQPDDCDLGTGTSADCNGDGQPDECGVLNDCTADRLGLDEYAPASQFGAACAASGEWVVVGAPGYVNGWGTAYVFQREAVRWSRSAELVPFDSVLGDETGRSVAVDGNHILVGSPQAALVNPIGQQFAAGKATVFELTPNNTWEQRASLTPLIHDIHAQDHFAAAVALDGKRALIGRPDSDEVRGALGAGNSGSAFVFRRDWDRWSYEAKLVADDADESDQFGSAVAIRGDVAMVGAVGDRPPSLPTGALGSVYVFQRFGSRWYQTQRLNGDAALSPQRFGGSVSIDGGRAAIGDSTAQLVYVFRREAAAWVQEAILRGSDTSTESTGDRFGASVALSGKFLVVGAERDDDGGLGNSGTAFLFQYESGTWVERRKLHAPDAAAGDRFGSAVATDGRNLVVGARLADDPSGATDGGAAYVFPMTSEDCNCNARADACELADGSATDCNTNRVLDGCELDAGFATDCNANGVLDECDLAAGTSADCNGDGRPDECGVYAPCAVEGIVPAENVERSGYASSLAAEETIAAVGAPLPTAETGAVYVFERVGLDWVESAVLRPDWEHQVRDFGRSVSVSGGRVLVGTPMTNVPRYGSLQWRSGAAFMYQRDDAGAWRQSAVLVPGPNDIARDDAFGAAVALDGDRALVGMPQSDEVLTPASFGASGSAFVFRFDGTHWRLEDKLLAADADVNDQFGTTVALQGDWAMVGAIGDRIPTVSNGPVGSVYVFHREGGVWTQVQRLNASDASSPRLFGASLSITGDVAAVGDRLGNFVYVFRRHGAQWIEEAKFRGDDTVSGTHGDRFGVSVAVRNDLLVVGADRYNLGSLSNSGAVYLFRHAGNQWMQVRKVNPPDPGDQFGYVVALAESQVLAGARLGGETHDTGVVYVIGTFGEDCNCDGLADICQMQEGDLGDCDGDGIPDVCDPDDLTAGDCDVNGVPDYCDPQADCNTNDVQDICDIAAGTSRDCDSNRVPDECDPDCQPNGQPDACDFLTGVSADCNANQVPDECDLTTGGSVDCNANYIPDECERPGHDCNGNGVLDECDLASGAVADCNENAVPDACELDNTDCNGNGVLDDCDLAAGSSADCDADGRPDECGVLAECAAQTLVAGDGQQGDRFGSACAASRRWAVIGAPGRGSGAGAAYVFGRGADGWSQAARLTPNGVQPGDDAGQSVAASGERIVIGIPEATGTPTQGPQFRAGAAAVFRFDGAFWVEEGRLIAAPAYVETHAEDEFGSAVAMDADRIIVGRPKSDEVPGPAGIGDSGSAFVFRYDGATWVQEAKLLAADAGSGDLFGIAVAIDGDWAMVAAIGDRIPTVVAGPVGSVYVFHRQGAAWVQTQRLNASDAAASRLFGSSLSLLGDTAAVGDRSASGHYAYVFRRHGMTWIEEAKVRGSDTTAGNAGDRFGVSVALAPNLLAVGADRDDDLGVSGSGTVFIFEYQAGRWLETRKLHAPGAAINDRFGVAIAAAGGSLFVGAPLVDLSGFADAGAAYALPIVATDCNCNRLADACEIAAGDLGDCDLDGVPDICDPDDPDATDCDGNGKPDYCDPRTDCNRNGLADACEIAAGDLGDCDLDGVPDICDPDDADATDCDGNGKPDYCDPQADCNANGVQDICDIAAGTSQDCGANRVPDECDPDCQPNGVPDACDIASGRSTDCNANGIPEECDLASGAVADCNGNAVADSCELDGNDCNGNGVPDECDLGDGANSDCNASSIPDECELEDNDCNVNRVPDECDTDCQPNGVPDECELLDGTATDCDDNGVLDECDLAAGAVADCNGNAFPDSCEVDNNDCNGNGVPDDCDLAAGFSADCDADGRPDECGVLAECEAQTLAAGDGQQSDQFGSACAASHR
ncbi:MAG: hypothetical protein HY763_00555, partial [Planctomycetes bacterium]|nr:hypothetical protein [Planctomycetota bacterium]